MHLNLLRVLPLAFITLTYASSLLPIRASRRPGCDSAPSAEALAAIKALKESEDQSGVDPSTLTIRQTITVQVYFHAVTNTSISASYPSDSLFSTQLSVMNNAYASTGIRFVLAGTDRVRNNDLATGSGLFADTPSAAMQTYLKQNRKGTYKDLNLYFYTNAPSDSFGKCFFPTSPTPATTSLAYAEDGCHIATGTMPGQDFVDYNLGMTAVHEVGHWFSLLHPFEGNSCTGSGDFVSDTPQESSPSYGCPVGKDSCPNISGVDPIHNYMDYSQDSCYQSFTAGQISRMANAWSTLRAGK
ncbi:hypothetical protein JX265_001514 [Neoarthrinium moseri]|uniref:Peptidase M43 pregnancy-associated plasma-A domain-containing protein n=1 Tax=Neoarthrinium moseri TaxID=1658444 RepID=A0A9P9WVD4_9PEZI|nr:uncharacterized protein JN550_003909 [Neoarthrinium moseri]KAI1841418.1 hypothetical protein JX266_012347 [Neoarthrinium moseri]KAI1872190.1 hypothetical protein JN550_003909 [Neoarthrinium moseri]KAI1879893.1 hypothetical protein JX265_001514 [Neoarthrinium moseri]